MPRKKLEISHSLPYHITNRTNNSEWFSLPPKECWEVFNDFLYLISKMYGLRPHLFVLMSNHYHLIATSPECPVGLPIMRLQTEIAQAINRLSGRSNHVFKGQYKGSLITTEEYYSTCYKYVVENPLAAGMVRSVLDYRYSTLYGQAGFDRLICPIFDSCFENVLPKILDRFSWADQMFDVDQREGIAKGLKRTRFTLAGESKSREVI
ncbi:MAG: hypothetical protein KDD25_04070 [Bdellovibrionales bacterium]|nr:hypothetical protein [Bdellovibrionales bacterium]